ncbi:serine/threonine-protein kinase Pink1, mitochondrial-like [Mya arenaria]|uniref:serine/threonine-protein kinase Pink1, mitochondrial-like n=1 Tax=Mya arenaria TaxID=6604 RepID=UPI0022E249AE|nr:serine/threonine-protein kinase Pink1, mitochondrial-like [Mya arenaria]
MNSMMSVFFRRGRKIFENVFKRNTPKVVERTAITRLNTVGRERQFLLHRLFPKKFSNSPVVQLSRTAFWSNPRKGNVLLFALTGIVIAQKSEDDNVLSEIQAFGKCGHNEAEPSLSLLVKDLSLDSFEIGRNIGQGCNAVVYEASWKTDLLSGSRDDDLVSEADSEVTVLSVEEMSHDDQPPAVFTVETVPDEDDIMSVTESLDSDISVLELEDGEDWLQVNTTSLTMSDHAVDWTISPGRDTIIDDENDDEHLEYLSLDSRHSGLQAGMHYDLAIKMLFNYSVESRADAILHEMERETVPARLADTHPDMLTWQNGHKVRKRRLPPHQNIVDMWGLFVGLVPELPDGADNYPAALPTRIHPDGIGRNMTLFLVMKRYNTTLNDYLAVVSLSVRERLYLLAQILEGVAHMNRHSVAHRDMKSDNILLDTFKDGEPQLVISDFGCCLSDCRFGLRLPYTTDHIDRGGNTALMAPEISCAEPGLFSILDYRKADLWAVGALTYEIFGADNPFYRGHQGRLDSRTYTLQELPPLPDCVPEPVGRLSQSILDRNPAKRPTARQAADVIQLMLWAPSDWLLPGNQLCRSNVMWWLVGMATEAHLSNRSTLNDLKRSFLENIDTTRLKNAFSFFEVDLLI